MDSLGRHLKLHATSRVADPNVTTWQGLADTSQHESPRDRGLDAEHSNTTTNGNTEGHDTVHGQEGSNELEMSAPPWPDPDDLLTLLTSNSHAFFDSLPLTQFSPSAFSDLNALFESAADPDQASKRMQVASQGQQAIQHMSRLIFDLVGP